MTGRSVGISLGTTNTFVAVLRDGVPVVIADEAGRRDIPCVVAYGRDGEVLVGHDAEPSDDDYWARNTLRAAKRLLARRFDDDAVRYWRRLIPYKIVAADNGDAWFEVAGRTLSPVEVVASVLARARQRAELHLGEAIHDVVIAVPAYFNESQRQATDAAARIAGLAVKRFINDTTATALAYASVKNPQEQTVAVCDVGGGTFDVSIMQIDRIDDEDYTVEVLATSGDSSLGGEDIDLHIVELLADEFGKSNGIDLRADAVALMRLKRAAAKAKVALSTGRDETISMPYIATDGAGTPQHLEFKLTRAHLERLMEDMVQRMLAPCNRALADAGKTASDVDELILVGGQSATPKVRVAIEKVFKKTPRTVVDPVESVAMGAAIQAGVLSGEITNVLVLDVTPLSLGIETLGGVMTRLIERNTTIPTRVAQVFSTAEDNQDAVTVHILQGEYERAADNKSLGRFDLSGIPPAPRGVPQIEVTFDVDASGMLHVSAIDKATGRQQSVEVSAPSGLSEQEIHRMIADAETNADKDRQFGRLVAARNEAESLVYSVKRSLADAPTELPPDLTKAVKSAIKGLEQAIRGDDIAQIDGATQRLSATSAKIGEFWYAERKEEHVHPRASTADRGAQTAPPATDDHEDGRKIFISYRRETGGMVTGWLYEKLINHYPPQDVFIDIDAIPLGVDFRKYLDREVGKCRVMLVVIDKDWLSVRDENGNRRLDDPRDFVRIEIESALKREIPIIPLLIQSARIPGHDDLPSSLSELAFRNASQIRGGHDFQRDVERLIKGIDHLLDSDAN